MHQCTNAPMHQCINAPTHQRTDAPTHQGAELKQLSYEADELRQQQVAHQQWRRRVRRVLKRHAVAAESAAAAEGGMAASVSVSVSAEAAEGMAAAADGEAEEGGTSAAAVAAAAAAAVEGSDEPGPQGEAELRAALAREVAARGVAQAACTRLEAELVEERQAGRLSAERLQQQIALLSEVRLTLT